MKLSASEKNALRKCPSGYADYDFTPVKRETGIQPEYETFRDVHREFTDMFMSDYQRKQSTTRMQKRTAQ
jgi:hypothetical protein